MSSERCWLARWFDHRFAALHPAAPALAMMLAGYAVLAPTALVVGWALTELDGALGWLPDADREVVRWVAERRTSSLDVVASAATSLTDTWTVVGLTAGAGSVLLASRRWHELTLLAVGLLVELAAYASVTFTVARPRPDVAAGALPVTGSFPSGHAAMAVVLYGAMAAIVRSLAPDATGRRATLATAVVVPAAVGLSRIYYGLHYPSDVAVGWALGAACLALAMAAADTRRGTCGQRP